MSSFLLFIIIILSLIEVFSSFPSDIRCLEFHTPHRIRHRRHLREHRNKRYAVEGSFWGVNQLTYKISRYSSKMSRSSLEKVLKKAFNVWEESTNLEFIFKPSGQAHINIGFYQKAHGDGENFDGPGRVLAHAFFPRYGGDVHFDDSESWAPSKGVDGTVDFYMVATHEIGHALGLKHSSNPLAIMAEFYQQYTGDHIHLHDDDIHAMSLLYKPRNKSTPIREDDKITVKPVPDICKNPTIDTITVLGNGTLYAFKGEWFWRLLDEGGIEKGYPRLIIDSWPFDSNIDDILTDGDGDSYVFKGDKYWLLNRDGELQKGYPWRINRGLIDMPDDIDAAFIYSEDDQPYMFKKDRYWPYSRFGMGRQWPKSTKGIFKGEIPSKIDAALRFNDQSFLFVGTKYYKVNGFRMRISEGYPKSIGDQWFGCDGNSHHIK